MSRTNFAELIEWSTREFGKSVQVFSKYIPELLFVLDSVGKYFIRTIVKPYSMTESNQRSV
jgi:hypothetical protein